jgi:DNA helicase-2/ATP-dependent DNA helicase PcrA
VCAYIESPNPELVKQGERELFTLLLTVTGRANLSVFSFPGRRTMFRLLKIGQRILNENESGVLWLQQSAHEMGKLLFDERMLPANGVELLAQSAGDMIADMKRNGVDLAQLTIGDLGMFADPSNSMKLMTIHSAKGREFDAVAIIGLHDGILPWYNNFNPLSAAGVEEGRRLFYVAATRARRVLLFVTDKDQWRPKSRYLTEIGL